MPNASDTSAATEATQACLSAGWLATAACHGRSIQRWIGRATAPKPRSQSARPYRPPTWE